MGRLAELPFGLATSVGTQPFDDASSAVDLALSVHPAFPTVPTSQFAGGSLLDQAVASISGVAASPPGLLETDKTFDVDSSLGPIDLGSAAFDALQLFLRRLPNHIAELDGPFRGVRVDVLGPVTLALRLRAAGVPFGDAVELSRQVVPELAAGTLSLIRSVLPEDVVAVVMSEPGLIGAMHPTFPLVPTQILSLLGPVVDSLDALAGQDDLAIGVHVPGSTDWDTIIASGVSMISAPATDSLVSWSNGLARFIGLGGRVIWGAVPVDQPFGTGEELLWRRLGSVWCALVGEGLDPFQLRASSLIAPVDGLGQFGVSQAIQLLGIVDSLAERVRRQAIGARLSLGA